MEKGTVFLRISMFNSQLILAQINIEQKCRWIHTRYIDVGEMKEYSDRWKRASEKSQRKSECVPREAQHFPYERRTAGLVEDESLPSRGASILFPFWG